MELLLIVIIGVGILLYYYAKKKNLVPIKKDSSPSQKNVREVFKNGIVTQQVAFNLDFERSDKRLGKYLVVDTETTGLPVNRYARPEDYDNWPYILQIAWYLFDDEGKLVDEKEYILKQNVQIPVDATSIHGIDNGLMMKRGVDPKLVYSQFVEALGRAKFLIAHNIAFDKPIIECELLRNGFDNKLLNIDTVCTMEAGKYFCELPGYVGDYKYPKLTELFHKCFFPESPVFSIAGMNWLDGSSNEARKAAIDASITAKCFFKLKELNIITEMERKFIDQRAQEELKRKSPVLKEEEVVYFHSNKKFDVKPSDDLTLDLKDLTVGASVPNCLKVLNNNGEIIGEICDSFNMQNHIKPILKGNRYKVSVTSLDEESNVGRAQIIIYKKSYKG